MAPVLLLLVLLAEAASDLKEVTVDPGDDVLLPCRADFSVRAVEWTRPDLEPDTVLFYRDGHLETDDENPSYKDRVDLVDRNLKDGDVSLTLKNVNINDTGTYKCRVVIGDLGRRKRDIIDSEPIRIINVQVTDVGEVTVDPGDDVLLPCRANSSISVVEWSRPDLEPDTVLLYRDGHLETDNQHPSFKDRVDLVDRDLKDRDASLTLKNVNINDTGTYKCRVKTNDQIRVRIIHLQVTGPEDGPSPGLVAGVVGLLLVAAVIVAVVGVLMYKRPKKPVKRPASDKFKLSEMIRLGYV